MGEYPTVYSRLFLAMAHHRLGHEEEAKRWLDRAIRWLDEPSNRQRLSPSEHLEYQLLRREAEELLKKEK